eukprot:7048510-Alexandrium_andersonii.AAC.1
MSEHLHASPGPLSKVLWAPRFAGPHTPNRRRALSTAGSQLTEARKSECAHASPDPLATSAKTALNRTQAA